MLLDDSRLEALEFATPATPPSMQRTENMWTHTDTTNDERRSRWIIGGILILVGLASWAVIGGMFLRHIDDDSANFFMYWGQVLFFVPFTLFGFVSIAAGLALPNTRVEHRFGALGIRRQVRLFTFVVTELHVLSTQMLALRVFPASNYANGLALGIITQSGVLPLPIHVTDALNKTDPRLLRRYARWLVDVLHRPALPFDSKPIGVSPEKMLNLNAWPFLVRQLRRLAGAAMVIGMLGFSFIFFGATQIEKDVPPSKSTVATKETSTQSASDAIPKDIQFRESAASVNNANNMAQLTTKRPSDCEYVDIAFCGTLSWAVIEKRPDVVMRLFSEAPDPVMLATAPDKRGWSAWAYALAKGNPAMVKLFVEQGVPTKGAHFFPFDNRSQQIPPLLFAIQYNNAAAIGILIANGADAFATATWGYPTANFAAYYGYVESLRALGEAGVDLNLAIPAGRPYAGETMLMHAAQGGKMAAIEYLQANGGKIGQADSRGNTAVDHATRYGHTALALQLRMKQLME
jgi:hypothetical protein